MFGSFNTFNQSAGAATERSLHVVWDRCRMVAADATRGFWELLHNGFALIGLVVALALGTLVFKPEVRHAGELQLAAWLQERVEQRAGMSTEPDAIDRATALHLKQLPREQAVVASWLANKYRVAPEPLAALVVEAHELAKTTHIDAHLILAIAAVESGFNPFAQSPVGAQGLMQVMTGIHQDKYQHFGGKLAAFDPVTNLRVGVKVLQECIQRAGSLDAGLKFYVGAALHDTDGGYAAKVYAEQARLRDVARGRAVPYMPPGGLISASNGQADLLADVRAVKSAAQDAQAATDITPAVGGSLFDRHVPTAPAAQAPSSAVGQGQQPRDPVTLNKM